MKSIKSSLDFIFLVLQNKNKICIFYFTVIHIVLKNLGILDIRTFTFSDEKKETQLLFRQYKNMRTYIGLTLFYWSSITFEPRPWEVHQQQYCPGAPHLSWQSVTMVQPGGQFQSQTMAQWPTSLFPENQNQIIVSE